MLSGVILLIAGIALFALCVVIPRLYEKINATLGDIPKEFQGMAAQMMPGMSQGLALVRLLPMLAKACGVGGLVYVLLGIYAFVARPVPVWLHALAALACFGMLATGAGLLLAKKRLSPYKQEMQDAKELLEMKKRMGL